MILCYNMRILIKTNLMHKYPPKLLFSQKRLVNVFKSFEELPKPTVEQKEYADLRDILLQVGELFKVYRSKVDEGMEYLKDKSEKDTPELKDLNKCLQEYQSCYLALFNHLKKNGFIDEKDKIIVPEEVATNEDIAQKTALQLKNALSSGIKEKAAFEKAGTKLGDQYNRLLADKNPLVGLTPEFLEGLGIKEPKPPEEEPVKPAISKDKTPAAAPAAVSPEKKLSRESPEYWAAFYRDITRKIIAKADTGEEKPLSSDEKLAIMLMKGGETMTIKLDEREYLLERDQMGRYIRIRDYKPTPEPDDPDFQKLLEASNPYICTSGKKERPPIWKNRAVSDVMLDKLDKGREEFDKQVSWLFSDSAPMGSKVVFSNILGREKVKDSADEKIHRVEVEMIKQADNSVRTRYLEQFLIKRGKKFLHEPGTVEKTSICADAEECRRLFARIIRPETNISAYAAGLEEQEHERRLYIDENMNKLAGNLNRASIFTYMNDAFKEWLGKMQAFIKDNGVENWKQKPEEGFKNRHVEVVDGKITVFKKNPEYEVHEKKLAAKQRKGGKTAEEAGPEEAPPLYLTIYPIFKGPEEGEEKIA